MFFQVHVYKRPINNKTSAAVNIIINGHEVISLILCTEHLVRAPISHLIKPVSQLLLFILRPLPSYLMTYSYHEGENPV